MQTPDGMLTVVFAFSSALIRASRLVKFWLTAEDEIVVPEVNMFGTAATARIGAVSRRVMTHHLCFQKRFVESDIAVLRRRSR